MASDIGRTHALENEWNTGIIKVPLHRARNYRSIHESSNAQTILMALGSAVGMRPTTSVRQTTRDVSAQSGFRKAAPP